MLQMNMNPNYVFKLVEKEIGEECLWSRYDKALPIIFLESFELFNCVTPSHSFVLAIPFQPSIVFDYVRGLNNLLRPNIRFFISDPYLQIQSSLHGISFYDPYGKYHEETTSMNYREFAYTKTTQLVAKYLLFNKEGNYSTRKIAEFFNISNTSVKRAYDFLISIGSVYRNGGNTSTATFAYLSKQKLFDALREHFIYPINGTLTVFFTEKDTDENKDRLLLGAETVLYNNTDLEHSNIIEYAVDKETYDYFLNNASKYYPLDGDMVNIEQWIYNPNYFSKNGCIDTFDAYIVLSKRYKKHGDPRIEKALKKLERMIVNGQN